MSLIFRISSSTLLFHLFFLHFLQMTLITARRHRLSRQRESRPQPAKDPLQDISFDSFCKVACYKEFCMPAPIFCKRFRGLHQCCGGPGVPPPATEAPTTLIPPLSTQTTPPTDCSKLHTPAFCMSYPDNKCCTDPPSSITPKPSKQICLFGDCVQRKIKVRFCKIVDPPKFGGKTLTIKLYCKHINKDHRCCKRGPSSGKKKTGGHDVIALPNRTRTPPSTKVPSLQVPPGCPGYSVSLGQKRLSLGLGLTHLQRKPRKLRHGSRRRGSKKIEDATVPAEEVTEIPEDPMLCTREPSHRCCVGNVTEINPAVTSAPGAASGSAGATDGTPEEEVDIYDNTTALVPCEEYNEDLAECRLTPGCGVQCQDRSCRLKTDIPMQCTKVCSSSCEDLCGCKMSGCEYHPPTGNCRPSGLICHNRHFSQSEECRRNITFYSFGGELCLNFASEGNCEIEETILAVNLGNGGNHLDSRGIPYQADKDIEYDDTLSSRKTGLATKLFGAELKDKGLYETFIYGGIQVADRDKCLSYKINLCRDGNYELAIRTVDGFHKKEGERFFNVKFNGQIVFPEIDVMSLTKETNHVADISINFLVQNNGKTLILGGFEPSKIVGGVVKLEFCLSDCETVINPNFILSAFSVVKFTNGKKGIDQLCASAHFDMCQCKKSGCEYDNVRGHCHARSKDCSISRNPSKKCGDKSQVGPKCRRPGVLYADGGVICQNEVATGVCNVEETILAVNINGGNMSDGRGINYLADDGSLYKDTWGIREARVMTKNINNGTSNCPKLDNGKFVAGVYKEEIPLYETLVFGSSTKRELGRCISFPVDMVKLAKDGKYELGLKMVEFLHEEYKMRYFNVRFADILVLPEFDILEYTQRCTGIDVIVPFEVTDGGTHLSVKGHPRKPLGDELVDLSFCYGECYQDQLYVDPDFLISAFYIARMQENEKRIPYSLPYSTIL